MQKLSIVGRDYATEEGVVGYYNAGDRMKAWGKTGAFWGGFWGMLFGSALFVIPGIGPLFAAGPLVAWIVGALEGATVVGGMSALGAGLYRIGIPKDSVLNYETQIKAGKFVVIAHGTRDEVAKSKTILLGAEHHDGNKTELLRVGPGPTRFRTIRRPALVQVVQRHLNESVASTGGAGVRRIRCRSMTSSSSHLSPTLWRMIMNETRPR